MPIGNQIFFQYSATDNMLNIIILHNHIIFFLVMVLTTVLYLFSVLINRSVILWQKLTKSFMDIWIKKYLTVNYLSHNVVLEIVGAKFLKNSVYSIFTRNSNMFLAVSAVNEATTMFKTAQVIQGLGIIFLAICTVHVLNVVILAPLLLTAGTNVIQFSNNALTPVIEQALSNPEASVVISGLTGLGSAVSKILTASCSSSLTDGDTVVIPATKLLQIFFNFGDLLSEQQILKIVQNLIIIGANPNTITYFMQVFNKFAQQINDAHEQLNQYNNFIPIDFYDPSKD